MQACDIDCGDVGELALAELRIDEPFKQLAIFRRRSRLPPRLGVLGDEPAKSLLDRGLADQDVPRGGRVIVLGYLVEEIPRRGARLLGVITSARPIVNLRWRP